MKRNIAILILLLTANAVYAENGPCVIPARSHFRIHVGTSGLFAAFAHDHLIEAQMMEGCAAVDTKDLKNSSIKLTFPAAGLRVLDPSESEKDRATVQHNMETDVLRISEFPRVVFVSTAIESGKAAGQFLVHGNLTIRDKTQAVIIPVTFTRQADGTYQAVGKYSFKQTSFGIKPIQLAGGTVKVKDDLQTEFELFLK